MREILESHLLETNAADPRRHSSTVGDKTFAEEAELWYFVQYVVSGCQFRCCSSECLCRLNVSLSSR
jgi:hypothetical protein